MKMTAEERIMELVKKSIEFNKKYGEAFKLIQKSIEFDEKYAGTPFVWVAQVTCPVCNSNLLMKPIGFKPDGSLEILVVEDKTNEKIKEE